MSGKKFTLSEIAKHISAELIGDPNREVVGIATLAQAQANQISFLDNPRYKKHLATTQAAGVILHQDNVAENPTTALVVANPYLAYAKAATLFEHRSQCIAGIHPTAIIHPSAKVDASASVGPFCVVGERVVIGANAEVGASCTIGDDSIIGEDTKLWPRVTVCHAVKMGKRVIVHSGAVIGSDGFGLAKSKEGWLKIPQLGSVVLEDEVEIGANTTIDRGSLDDTVIGFGAKLDNQIQVAHNVKIGAYTAIAGCAGIAGSTEIGKHCLIAGGVGIAGHLTIADYVTITGMTLVSKSITEPGAYSSGTSLQTNQEWKKSAVRFRQLDDLVKRVQQLEAKVKD